MIVTEDSFDQLLEDLTLSTEIGFDTETYGLGFEDPLFCLTLATQTNSYYLNFNQHADHLGVFPPVVLPRGLLRFLEYAFKDTRKLWYSHNAGFDMQKIKLEGVIPPQNVHCSRVAERLIRNDTEFLSLEKTAPRYGFEKDDTVDKYLEKYKLFTKVDIPGKSRKDKVKHFDLIPFDIITHYGETDARIHRAIGIAQRKKHVALLQ